MRLLNTSSLTLEFFVGEAPEYAILSHRWEDEEVNFHDLLHDGMVSSMKGYAKVQRSAEKARQDGYQYIWIDTCCIDKSSSAELSEAINSMFQWYRKSARCLVYLSDVSSLHDFAQSRWFTRGWTLQELIAPRQVHFLDKNWNSLGTKSDLFNLLHQITGIGESVLVGTGLALTPVCGKMSWAASRVTTRPEDIAYCLLGLVGVNMPLLYGEGAERAFQRLQEEFIRQSEDETIFAWTAADEGAHVLFWGLLAPSPAYFKDSGSYTIPHFKVTRHGPATEITNKGVGVMLTLQPLEGDASETQFLAPMNCSCLQDDPNDIESAFTITLQKLSGFENQYARVRPDRIIPIGGSTEPLSSHQVYVRSRQKRTDPAAGFCFDATQVVQFRFESNSPHGPLMYPGRVEAAFNANYPAIEYRDPAKKIHLIKLNKENTNLNVVDFNSNVLEQRVIVGSVKLSLTGWFGRDPVPSSDMVPKTVYDRVLPRASYVDPYLIVGFEPLPENALCTPPGFVRPWYSFSSSNETSVLQGLVSPEEKLQLSYTAPGGTSIAAEFRPTSHQFRTWQEILLVDARK